MNDAIYYMFFGMMSPKTKYRKVVLTSFLVYYYGEL